jgi:two-component system, cell cycle sensor histidine kinase PleC
MSDSPGNINDAKQALRHAEAALELAMKKEAKSVAEQQLRIAELAHEVRTPLNAVIGYAQILSQEIMGPMGKQEYVEYARIIHSAADHLLQICDGMLSEFSPEGKTDSISVEEVDAGHVIGSVVDLFSWMARERGVTLDAEVDENFPKLNTDPTRLNQILINLVSNAIKFTPKGGSVNVAARTDETDGATILVIQDNGEGMSEAEMLERLEPFIKSEGSSPHGDTGTGLGLAIAHRLLSDLQGQMCMASAKGQGTIISIKLPKEGSGDDQPLQSRISLRQARSDEFAPLIS